MSKLSPSIASEASAFFQEERDQTVLNAPAMKNLIAKFQDDGRPVGLQDINNILRKVAPINPALAVTLIATKQNVVSSPATPVDAAGALLAAARRFPDVADAAFAAVLKNTDQKSQIHARSFIDFSLVQDPVEKIGKSASCFRELLLGELVFIKYGYAGSATLGPHTEIAIAALCHIGGKKAEEELEAKRQSIEGFSPGTFSDVYKTFPTMEKMHKADLITDQFKYGNNINVSAAISSFKALDDGKFIEHLSNVAGYTSAQSRPFIIYALAELQTEDAADTIYDIAKYNEESRLEALGALGSMRREEVLKGTNDLSFYDSRIQALLHQTLDLEKLQKTFSETRGHYRTFFNQAAEEGSVPHEKAELFERAVQWVDEEDALTSAIENLEPVNPVAKDRSMRADLIDFSGPQNG